MEAHAPVCKLEEYTFSGPQMKDWLRHSSLKIFFKNTIKREKFQMELTTAAFSCLSSHNFVLISLTLSKRSCLSQNFITFSTVILILILKVYCGSANLKQKLQFNNNKKYNVFQEQQQQRKLPSGSFLILWIYNFLPLLLPKLEIF